MKMNAIDGEKREESKHKIKSTKKQQKTPKNTKKHQKTPKRKTTKNSKENKTTKNTKTHTQKKKANDPRSGAPDAPLFFPSTVPGRLQEVILDLFLGRQGRDL